MRHRPAACGGDAGLWRVRGTESSCGSKASRCAGRMGEREREGRGTHLLFPPSSRLFCPARRRPPRRSRWRRQLAVNSRGRKPKGGASRGLGAGCGGSRPAASPPAAGLLHPVEGERERSLDAGCVPPAHRAGGVRVRERKVCVRGHREGERRGVVHERRRRAQGRAATEGPRGPRRSPRGGRAREEGRAGARGGRTARHGQATWLILPVVICSAQRLSHACLGIRAPARNCERLITTVVIRMALSALVG